MCIFFNLYCCVERVASETLHNRDYLIYSVMIKSIPKRPAVLLTCLSQHSFHLLYCFILFKCDLQIVLHSVILRNTLCHVIYRLIVLDMHLCGSYKPFWPTLRYETFQLFYVPSLNRELKALEGFPSLLIPIDGSFHLQSSCIRILTSFFPFCSGRFVANLLEKLVAECVTLDWYEYLKT